MSCLTCNNYSYPLCKKCFKNPYFIEKARRHLAKANKKKYLSKMYNRNLPEIKDTNSSKYWNKKFSSPVFFENEAPVVREKVKTVASFTPKNNKKILDIGVGLGLVEEYLLKKDEAYDFYGIDISENSINTVKKRVKGNFEVGSLYKLAYKAESFDVVLALDVLEHIPPSKIKEVLVNISKLLKKSGKLIGSIPLNEKLWSLSENDSSHLREYSRELLESELETAGFRLVEYKTLIAFSNYYLLKKIISRYFLPRRWSPNELIFKAQKI